MTVDLRSIPASSGRSPDSQVQGGCKLELRGDAIDMHVLTVVEEMLFAKCEVEIVAAIDGSGRIGISEYHVFGGSPCYDVRGCHPRTGKPRPMAGRIVAVEGKPRMDIDMCLDTCMGRFEGPFTMDLRRHRRSWRAAAADATIGFSGWKLDGVMEFRRGGRGLKLEPVTNAQINP